MTMPLDAPQPVVPDTPAAKRQELNYIQAKYDGGGMPLAIYAVCQKLEREIAWTHHARDVRLAG